MATENTKIQCSISTCKEDTSTFLCRGCSKDFCFDHLTEHRQILNTQLHEIQHDCNQFRQTLIEQKNDLENHILIQQINQWEKDSINLIKRTAQQCRKRLTKYTNKIINEIEVALDDPNERLNSTGGENKLNEIHLNQLREKLNKLKEELKKLTNVSIEQKSSFFINKIVVIIPLDKDTTWNQCGITVAGGNGQGNKLNQLSNPEGIFIDDDDQTIYTADWGNDRIVEWKCNATRGHIIAGGNGHGNKMNQLYRPTDVIIDQETNSWIITDKENKRVMRWSRKNSTNGEMIISDFNCSRLTMDKDGSLYVSNRGKNEVRRWKRGEKGEGTIVAGGNGQGGELNQLNGPIYVFIDEDYSLYISDSKNHRIMKWEKDAKEGIVVAGGNGQGNSLKQLSLPSGVIVDQFGQIYIAEWSNHRVMRWCKGAKEGTIVVGGNGQGQQSNQLFCPSGLSFDRQGNLYVTDCNNHRIQKFEIE